MSFQTDNQELRVLTIEELKQFDGLNDLSDEQALEIITTLKELSLISHNIVTNYGNTQPIPMLRKAE